MDWLIDLILLFTVPVIFIICGSILTFCNIKKNSWFGFRTDATMEDPAKWKKGNALTGKAFLFVGIVLLIAEFIYFFVNDRTIGSGGLISFVAIETISAIAMAIGVSCSLEKDI